ncbi:hypothetical protein DFH08DRAFT_1082794 [Mycena albidolilacea]|uniref:Uncharacterized protein n=1 Tax=Mycena albidolilacea TaxID=1033008 RepID=A0AAD7EMD4_9AGAR|nr:hypothetical protein DFH08DRAFT_1082794 [Mycena albidolilacea]
MPPSRSPRLRTATASETLCPARTLPNAAALSTPPRPLLAEYLSTIPPTAACPADERVRASASFRTSSRPSSLRRRPARLSSSSSLLHASRTPSRLALPAFLPMRPSSSGTVHASSSSHVHLYLSSSKTTPATKPKRLACSDTRWGRSSALRAVERVSRSGGWSVAVLDRASSGFSGCGGGIRIIDAFGASASGSACISKAYAVVERPGGRGGHHARGIGERCPWVGDGGWRHMDVMAPPRVEGKARVQDEAVMDVGVDVIATDTGACFMTDRRESIHRMPSHKAATRPAALVPALMQPHHRPHRRHPGRPTPWSKRSRGYQRFRGSARAPLCIHPDDKTPPCDGGCPNGAHLGDGEAWAMHQAIHRWVRRQGRARWGTVVVEAVEVRLGAGCDPTIKLDAVGGAHCRIADGVIAIDCGRAFAPSSTALGSVHILINSTPAPCTSQLDPHHRRLLSTHIPAGLDARPITVTDSADLKRTLALAASGHVRDLFGHVVRSAVNDSGERTHWAMPPPPPPPPPRCPPRCSPRSSTSSSTTLTRSERRRYATCISPVPRRSKPQGAWALAEGRVHREASPTKIDASVSAAGDPNATEERLLRRC